MCVGLLFPVSVLRAPEVGDQSAQTVALAAGESPARSTLALLSQPWGFTIYLVEGRITPHPLRNVPIILKLVEKSYFAFHQAQSEL